MCEAHLAPASEWRYTLCAAAVVRYLPVVWGRSMKVTEKPSRRAEARRPALTPRELEVVAQFAHGLSYDEVAVVLDISANTVRTYVRALYEKLRVTTKTEAVMVALQLGLLAYPPFARNNVSR